MARLARTEFATAEPLIVLRYAPGEQFHPHRDYIAPSALADAIERVLDVRELDVLPLERRRGLAQLADAVALGDGRLERRQQCRGHGAVVLVAHAVAGVTTPKLLHRRHQQIEIPQNPI